MNAEGGVPVQPGLLTSVMADNHLNGSLAIELLQPERVEDLHFFYTSKLQRPLHCVK